MRDSHHIEVSDEVAFFKIHDTNGDGFWDEMELRSMYGLERDVDPEARHVGTIINRAFQDLDADADRLISLQEYMRSKLPDWTEQEKKQEQQWIEQHAGDASSLPSPAAAARAYDDADRPQWQEHDDNEDHVPDKFRAHWSIKLKLIPWECWRYIKCCGGSSFIFVFP